MKAQGAPAGEAVALSKAAASARLLSAGGAKGEKVMKEATAIAVAEGTPLVRPTELKDADSLPIFSIPPSHICAADPNPFMSFSTGFKFFVLRTLGNSYFKGFGTGAITHAHRDENVLALSVCNLIAKLLSFGFQSSLPKLQVWSTATPTASRRVCAAR